MPGSAHRGSAGTAVCGRMRGAGPAPRILVVEDDDAVRFNIVSYLEDCGHEVQGCECGDAGLEAVRQGPPDLVLCDLRMPGMDGQDLLRQLREEYPGLPVIVVSGTGVLGDVVDALRNGAADFVTKPIQDMVVLEHVIDSALEKGRLRSELEQVNARLLNYVEQLEQDAIAGRRLQQQLMPPAERLLGAYRCRRRLLPSLQLSGDFVDYFVIDQRFLGFYLADVSGHGVSSAFVTVLLKSLVDRQLDRFRDEGVGVVVDPAALFERLNQDLLAQRAEKFVTMFYAVIDTETSALRFCNAGHFPTPLLADGAGGRFLDQRGFALGMLAQATFENATLAIAPGQALFLFSDGILDALPESTLDEKRARLLDAACRCRRQPEALLSGLDISGERAYPDDIALLIVERMI